MVVASILENGALRVAGVLKRDALAAS
jgi:hypothetical protein